RFRAIPCSSFFCSFPAFENPKLMPAVTTSKIPMILNIKFHPVFIENFLYLSRFFPVIQNHISLEHLLFQGLFHIWILHQGFPASSMCCCQFSTAPESTKK